MQTRRGAGALPPLADGLQLYLDSSQGVTLNGTTVSAWADLSGNGRNFTQGTAANQPTFNSADATFGGRPSIQFDGLNDGLTSASYADGSTACTVYAVLRGGTTGRVYTANGNGTIILQRTGVTTVQTVYFNTGATSKDFTAPATTTYRVAGTVVPATGVSALPTLYLDGASGGAYTGTTALDGTLTASIHAVGSNTSVSGSFYDGSIASILVYNVAHTAAQVAVVDKWLQERFDQTPPVRENLQVWLDAAKGITLNGLNVSAWADQSGNGRNFAQGTAALQPAYAATTTAFGNRPAITFDGFNDSLTCGAVTAFGQLTVYGALQFLDETLFRSAWSIGTVNSDSGSAVIFLTSAAGLIQVRGDRPAATVSGDEETYTYGATTRIAGTFDYSGGGTGPVLAYLNGATNGSPFGTWAAGGTTLNGTWAFGANGSGGATANVAWGGFLAYSGIHTPSQIALVDRWMQRRYDPDPPNKSGLQLWLDASKGVTLNGTGVSTWNDQSGNGRHFTQGTASKQPFYIGSDDKFGGRPAILFDGVNDCLRRTSALVAMSNATVYLVISDLGGNYWNTIFANGVWGTAGAFSFTTKNVNLVSMFYNNPGGSESSRDLTGITTNAAARFASVGAFGAGGALWTTYLNGAAGGATASSSATSGTTAVADLALGSDSPGLSGFSKVKIAAVLVYDTAHTAAEVATVDAWLRQRFESAPPVRESLQLYLDSSRGITLNGGTVSAWADQSGNGRNFTQGTAALQPTYNWVDASFGNQPSLSFDGLNDWLVGPTFPAMTNTTMYVVMLAQGYASYAHIFAIGNSGGDTDAVVMYMNAAINSVSTRYDKPVGTSSTRSMAIGAGPERLAYVGAISAGGALWTSYLNGAASTSGGSTLANSGGATTSTQLAALGNNRFGSQSFNGRIAAVLVYNTAHTAAEVALVDAWLRQRFDPPVPIRENLQLYLDAAKGVTLNGSTVSTWADQSGNARNFTQGTAANQPTYIASDVSFGGRPSLSFDGTNDGLISGSFADSTAMTIYAVFNGGTTGRVFSGGGAPLFILSRSGATTVAPEYYNVGSTTKLITASPSTVRFAFTGDMSNGAAALPTVYVDGVADATGYSSTAGTTASPINTTHGVGSNSGASGNFFNGRIAALLVYSGAHTATEVALVDNWLRQRFDPPPPVTDQLQLYLDSSKGVTLNGTTVSTWADQSGNARNFTQGTGANQPTYVASDAAFAGRPSLSFDGINDSLLNAVGWVESTQNGVTVYVVSYGGSVAFGRVYTGSSGSGSALVRQGSPTTTLQAQYFNTAGTIKDTTILLANATRSASVFNASAGATSVPKIYINGSDSGAAYSATAATGSGWASSTHGVGAAASGASDFFGGKIAAILVYGTEHTAAQVSVMDSWLRQRFDPPVPIRDGLETYLDSSLGITLNGGTVSAWADQSGNARNYAQGTAGNQPTYSAADASFGGRPSVAFDGINDFMTGGALAAYSNATVYIVQQRTAYTGNDSVLSIGTYAGAGSMTLFHTSTTSLKGFYVNPGSTESSRTVTLGAGSVARIAYSGALSAGGALWTTYVDGAAGGTNNLSDATAGGTSSTSVPYIGATFGGASGFFTGKIVAILIYSTAHTAAQVALMDSWLKMRYNL